MSTYKLTSILIVSMMWLFTSTHSIADDNEALIFGVVPQQSAKVLAATWGPVIAELSEETGLDIRFATASNIPTFEKRLAEGKYDIAYMNPYHYAVFSERAGYRAISKQENKLIRGILVVKKDSPITSIEQLHDKKVAFPAPLAFAATMIPQAILKAEGINIEPKYVQSHDSVYLTVSKGFFEAGGGIVRTLQNTPEPVQDQLRVLWTSEGYTPHAVAVNAKMSAQMQTNITSALLGIEDRALLDPIGFSNFGPAVDKDWDSIRALKINVASQPTQ